MGDINDEFWKEILEECDKDRNGMVLFSAYLLDLSHRIHGLTNEEKALILNNANYLYFNSALILIVFHLF